MADSFSNLNAAARLREFIRQVAGDVVDDLRPRDRFATIVSITAGNASILYPDEPGNAVTVPLAGEGPYGVGQVVRVTGKPGARYVDMPISYIQSVMSRNKNLFDNGRFKQNSSTVATTSPTNVAAATSAGYATLGVLPCDRWKVENITNSICSVYGAYPSASPLSSSVTAMLLRNNAAVTLANAGDFFSFSQGIEGLRLTELAWNSGSPRPFTVAIVVNATVAGTAIIEAEIVAGSANGYRCSQPITLLAGTNQCVANFPALPIAIGTPTSVAFMKVNVWSASGTTYNSGNIANLNKVWTLNPTSNTRAAGCTNFWSATSRAFDVYDMQAEVGTAFTGFEDVPSDDEQRRCMRMFQRHPYMKLTAVRNQTVNTSPGRIGSMLPVIMRATPTPTIFNGPVTIFDGINTGTFTTVGTNLCQPHMVEFDTGGGTIAALTANVPGPIVTYVSGSWAIDLDARI